LSFEKAYGLNDVRANHTLTEEARGSSSSEKRGQEAGIGGTGNGAGVGFRFWMQVIGAVGFGLRVSLRFRV
jgi:hypothetical protein